MSKGSYGTSMTTFRVKRRSDKRRKGHCPKSQAFQGEKCFGRPVGGVHPERLVHNKIHPSQIPGLAAAVRDAVLGKKATPKSKTKAKDRSRDFTSGAGAGDRAPRSRHGQQDAAAAVCCCAGSRRSPGHHQVRQAVPDRAAAFGPVPCARSGCAVRRGKGRQIPVRRRYRRRPVRPPQQRKPVAARRA